MIDRTLFDVLPIQEVVANASPSAWRDGLVVSQQPGALTIALLDGSEGTLMTGATPEVGEPVAVHPVAEVVAVGSTWYAARPLIGVDEAR
ncbi:nuclease [Georgenia yuyongxinii]|uniref:Nuclease n=1 Tax=Georgenia yuyongxinii TaxID=2589797 RepID=A0A5B8C4C4_9MICO|nr:nuclease [Georgenia yuyongxinii]QDC25424.1 nuclease [Georgenia yuyongxinii]